MRHSASGEMRAPDALSNSEMELSASLLFRVLEANGLETLTDSVTSIHEKMDMRVTPHLSERRYMASRTPRN